MWVNYFLDFNAAGMFVAFIGIHGNCKSTPIDMPLAGICSRIHCKTFAYLFTGSNQFKHDPKRGGEIKLMADVPQALQKVLWMASTATLLIILSKSKY